MNPAISECRSISLINCSVFFLSPKRPPTRAFFFHARAQGFFQFRLDLRSLLIPLQHRKSFNDLDIPNHRSVTKTALFFLALLFCSLVSNGLASQEITGRKNLFVTVYGPEEGLRQSMVSQVHPGFPRFVVAGFRRRAALLRRKPVHGIQNSLQRGLQQQR